ncbi:MAG: hypothetical protein ACYTF6_14610 [Planctomycetota bacterium]
MVTKKYTKVCVVFVCGMVLVLASSSCKKDSEQQTTSGTKVSTATTTSDVVKPERTPTGDEPQLKIVPLEGVGPVKFGMSRDEVAAALGQPEREEGGGVGMYYLKSKGISVTLDPRHGVREINCWSSEYPGIPSDRTFAGKTKEGIGMGATREQVVAAYGQPDRADPKGPLEILHYNELRAHFTLMKNSLVSIKISIRR